MSGLGNEITLMLKCIVVLTTEILFCNFFHNYSNVGIRLLLLLLRKIARFLSWNALFLSKKASVWHGAHMS